MTTIAAPSRGATARGTSKRRADTRAPARAKATPRAATRSLAVGRLGALFAIVTVFALVTAVLFHVVLAQNQLELDRLNVQIAAEQRIHEQRRLDASVLASPQHIIDQAQQLGLVQPPEPAIQLEVPGAPLPRTDNAAAADMIADWSKTKSSLAPLQP